MNTRQLLKQMVRFNQNRRRHERRVRDDSQRWSRLGRLATGGYMRLDGAGALVKSGSYDLYITKPPDGPAVWIHPSWLSR